MMRSEYGPDVYCDYTEQVESTWRDTGAGGPWFCMACGATDHNKTGG